MNINGFNADPEIPESVNHKLLGETRIKPMNDKEVVFLHGSGTGAWFGDRVTPCITTSAMFQGSATIRVLGIYQDTDAKSYINISHCFLVMNVS